MNHPANPAQPPVAAPAPKVLDEGLLDPAWFGGSKVFRETKDIDFIWVKPGLKLSGLQMRMKSWEPPVQKVAGRDEKDLQKMRELTYLFPIILRSNLNPLLVGKVRLSGAEGDVTLVGRFVDVNAGSDGAKFFVGFGAGSSTATWDLKIVDSKTNELLLAVHHRCVSGSAFSGIQDKMEKWSRRFGQVLLDTTCP